MLNQALETKGDKKLSAEDFIRKDAKDATIVCIALLNRTATSPSKLINQLNNYLIDRKGPFVDWIGTNFIGCYLNIIKRRRQENRLYCGFDTLISLSKGNLRHFLELCRTAFSVGYNYKNGNFHISEEVQSFASQQTSTSLFSEIKSFKPHGHQLQIFANRLGELFSLYQARLSQSEPEITHFSIDGGATGLSVEIKNLLIECEKWGVLYKTPATKTKSREIIDDYDWVLNPIYAPQFCISYRKRRKTTFLSSDIQSMFSIVKKDYDLLYNSRKISIQSSKKLIKNKTVQNDTENQGDFFDV